MTLAPARTLEDELDALLAGASSTCLVCGAAMERDGPSLACPACGSRLVPAPPGGREQISLL